jgi:hypothetical protein
VCYRVRRTHLGLSHPSHAPGVLPYCTCCLQPAASDFLQGLQQANLQQQQQQQQQQRHLQLLRSYSDGATSHLTLDARLGRQLPDLHRRTCLTAEQEPAAMTAYHSPFLVQPPPMLSDFSGPRCASKVSASSRLKRSMCLCKAEGFSVAEAPPRIQWLAGVGLMGPTASGAVL